jgi:hypothetical protein
VSEEGSHAKTQRREGKKKGFFSFTGIASVPCLSFTYLPLTTPGTTSDEYSLFHEA